MNRQQRFSIGQQIVLFISTVGGIVAGSFLMMTVM